MTAPVTSAASKSARPQASEHAPYYGKYTSLVPDGSIVETLRKQMGDTAALLSGVPADREEHRYAEGKWSVKEVVGHMADAERVFAYRLLRFSRGDETPLAMLFYPCLVIVLSTLPIAPLHWATPSARDLAILVAVGLLWPVAHALFATALKRSTIARLAPYEYSSIVWVVAIDFLVFAIAPSLTTLIGSAIIIVACLLLVERAPAAERVRP